MKGGRGSTTCPQPIDEARMLEMMNVHAAKTNLSKLLARVAKGEEIVIAKGGTPVAKLVPFVSVSPPRALGAFKGKIWMSEEALETPGWLLDAFEGVDGTLPPPAPKRRKR
ncbi:MAG TPA: type II toxin-antitoxin system prevent-host-death family antitoxin [Gemmatimonadaceae bacterium]